MKIAINSRDEKTLSELGRLLRSRNRLDEINAGGETVESLQAAQPLPDVLIFDRPSNDGADLAAIERLSNLHPRMAFIVLCHQQAPEFLLQAMRAGVRDVLPFPATPASLYAALERIEEKLERREHGNGKVLAFISCKGGSGATFIASNLGYALAADGQHGVENLLDIFAKEMRVAMTLTGVTSIAQIDRSTLV